MFSLSVSDLISSYSGDSKSFSFSWEIPDGYMSDIAFLKPLEFSIQIIAIDNGISVIFDELSTVVEYEKKKHSIHVSNFERIFRIHPDPLDADDVQPIKNNMIDLSPVLREEIIMAIHMDI